MKRTIPALLLVSILNGCAFDVIRMKQEPTSLTVSPTAPPAFRIQETTSFKLGTGYTRTLKEQTVWRYVGSVSQGDVFRTQDQILTVEGSNIHEAYIVVSGQKVVGFYLPVEKTFTPLPDPVSLSTKPAEHAINQ